MMTKRGVGAQGADTEVSPGRAGREPGQFVDDDIEILRHLALGASAEGMSHAVHLSARTIRRRIAAICGRLGVGTPVEAVVWAVRRGLV